MMIEEKAVEMLNQLEAMAKQYTPDVINAAVNVTRIDGALSVIGGAIMLACIYPICVFAISLYKFFSKKRKEEPYEDWEFCNIIVSIVGISTVILFAVFGIVLVLDIWNWVAIFEPKLYIAKQIMSL